MSNILLVYPPYIGRYISPPLGLGYIGSYLEANGYMVKIIDMAPLGYDLNDLGRWIKKNKPSVVGISFMTNQFSQAIEISRLVKSIDSNNKVIVGGHHASAFPDELLKYKTIDVVAIGEGEATMLELVRAFDRGHSDLSLIKGIAFQQDGLVIKTPKRQLFEDLDSLPMPLWREYPIDKYSTVIIGLNERLPVFSVLGTRGCPFRCTFCSSHIIFERKVRYRSPQNIFEELLTLHAQYGARHFNFVDDTLTINHKIINELCDLLIENGYNLKWSANARVNAVTPQLLQKMRQAGCINIHFGIESGDQSVRNKVHKEITNEQVKDAHKWARQAGMIVSSYFMVGNRGDGWESIKKSVRLAREIVTDNPTCSIATPFPGTEMFSEFERNNWIRVRDWDKYYTTPHLIQDYVPVCINDKMNQKEILDAYYYVNAEFAKIKMHTRYGKFYFLNHWFIQNEILNRLKKQGFINFMKLTYRMLKGLVRNVRDLRHI